MMTPARGGPPTSVVLQQVSAEALSTEARAGDAPLFECCSLGRRLPGTGQLTSARQTQRPMRRGTWSDTAVIRECQALHLTCVFFKEGTLLVGLVPLAGF